VDIRTVNLSLRVGGRLASLRVDEGDAVTPGQILGELDNQPYGNALLEAEANEAAQKAQLALLEAGYREEERAQVRSEVEERKVAYEYAEKFLRRQQRLLPSRAVSVNDVDTARAARNQSKAAYQAVRDKLAQYEAGARIQEIEAARAKLMQAGAALAQARLNLKDTVLKSPSAGIILTRAVEPGTMLAAGGTIFTLSLTTPVWVRAYVDEVHLGRAVPGAACRIRTDGRPDMPYTGSIGFVSPTAEFTPKSVEMPTLRTDLVYRLRIIVSDPDDGLRQGMPVTITFAE
jgi:HlyD family secretion protein